jgi:hypothetical protein
MMMRGRVADNSLLLLNIIKMKANNNAMADDDYTTTATTGVATFIINRMTRLHFLDHNIMVKKLDSIQFTYSM